MGFWDAFGDLLMTSALIGAQRHVEQQHNLARLQAQRIRELEDQLEDDENDDLDEVDEWDDDLDDDLDDEYRAAVAANLSTPNFAALSKAVSLLDNCCYFRIDKDLNSLPDLRSRFLGAIDNAPTATLTDFGDEILSFLNKSEPDLLEACRTYDYICKDWQVELLSHGVQRRINNARVYIVNHSATRWIFQGSLSSLKFLRVVYQHLEILPQLRPLEACVRKICANGLCWPGSRVSYQQLSEYFENFAITLAEFVPIWETVLPTIPEKYSRISAEYAVSIGLLLDTLDRSRQESTK